MGLKPEGDACDEGSPALERRSSVPWDHVYGEWGQVRKEAALNYGRGALGVAEWSDGSGSTFFVLGTHLGRASNNLFSEKKINQKTLFWKRNILWKEQMIKELYFGVVK